MRSAGVSPAFLGQIPRLSDKGLKIRPLIAMVDEERLIKQYLPLVRVVARRMAWAAEAADLESAGNLGLLKAVRNNNGRASFDAYVRKCVRGAMLDEIRHRFDSDSEVDAVDERESPETLASAGETAAAVQAAIARDAGLTQPEREVIVLILDGASVAAVARQLGIWPSVARARRERAYAKLRVCLARLR